MAPPTVDHFSTLPDTLIVTIIWLLPTRVAARTSVLSRRFRDLWKNSPSLELNSRDMPLPRAENFLAAADRVLLSRDVDSHPLLSLGLDISELSVSKHGSFFSSLFVKLCTSGLRHLAVEGQGIEHLLSDIFSVKSLETLSLPFIILMNPLSFSENYLFPSAVGLSRLRSLTLGLYRVDPAQFHQLISEFCFLEDLSIKVSCMSMLSIASNTIRKFNLLLVAGYHLDTVMLSLPLLEVFHLEPGRLLFKLPHQLPQFQGEIPLLRKAVLTIDCVRKKDCGRVIRLMNYVSHVQELVLDVKEDKSEKDPFLILLDSGKEVPNFPNLKHLEVTMCFCDHNLRAVISMIRHSSALESVKLVHELPEFTGEGRRRTRKDWKSKLPRIADRNVRYTYSRNLHLGENRSNFLKALSNKCTSKS